MPPSLTSIVSNNRWKKLLVYRGMSKDEEFGFKILNKNKPLTRRGILSIVSTVYDPLGFVAPFIVTAKMILLGLCKKKIGWDDEIDEAEIWNWEQWHCDLQELAKIVVTRGLKPAVLGENVISRDSTFRRCITACLWCRLVHSYG